jgi:iron complex outermembrane receptor protein
VRATRDSVVRDPRHWGQLRSTWDVSRRVELDADLRWIGAIDMQNVPAYAEANVRLGYQWSETIELSVTGENLLHNRHAEFNSPATRRFLSRAVFAKLTWRL